MAHSARAKRPDLGTYGEEYDGIRLHDDFGGFGLESGVDFQAPFTDLCVPTGFRPLRLSPSPTPPYARSPRLSCFSRVAGCASPC